MKVILVAVMSLDGKTTKWLDPHIYTWTSREDQAHFFGKIAKAQVVIMGKNTYLAVKDIIKLSTQTLRIIMTRTPEAFAQEVVPGKLEFTDKRPEVLLETLEKKGIKEVLLVGGSTINASFLQEKLVTDVWVTIEPKLFVEGTPLLQGEKLDVRLQLEEVKQLNTQGTLLVRYSMVY